MDSLHAVKSITCLLAVTTYMQSFTKSCRYKWTLIFCFAGRRLFFWDCKNIGEHFCRSCP